MKNLLLLLGGASLGIAAYVLFNQTNSQSPAANDIHAWGTGKRVSGTGNSALGSVKKGFGELTGDDSMEASGLVDKAKGAVQDAAGSVAQKIGEVARDAR